MTSKNVKDSATKVDTYRVDITIDNQTRESILPLHETTRPHPSFIEWAGLNTHPPRTEHMSLPAPPYRLLRTTGGQFQSDEHGNLRCAALVSGPNAMLVMVLIVEMSLAGPQMTKVLVVDRNTDFQSAAFKKQCDEAVAWQQFEGPSSGGGYKRYKVSGHWISKPTWPPSPKFVVELIDDVPISTQDWTNLVGK